MAVVVNQVKNRDRQKPTFANINLIGPCNCECFYCLGKDLKHRLDGVDQINENWTGWKHFPAFLEWCHELKIRSVYLTGLNTDPLLYLYLESLIRHLQNEGFDVGMRTNGYGAEKVLDTINLCRDEIGYTIPSFHHHTTKMITGRSDMPPWAEILPNTYKCRVSVVINRCNKHEFVDIVDEVSYYDNVRYVQARRISSETRAKMLAPDMAAYEEVYSRVREFYPLKETLWEDADVFTMFAKEVVFWRTVKTSINSINYFTNGKTSGNYFIIEGYNHA